MLWWGLLCVCMAGLAGAADPVGTCGLDGFNLDPLSRGTYWSFTINNPKENCIHDFPDDEIEGCTLFFSICKPLPKEMCSDAGTNVSVCQVVALTNGTEHHYDVGNYSTNHSFTALSNGFHAIWAGRQYLEEEQCNAAFLTSLFNFECDSDAKYDSSQPDITQYVSSAVRVPTSPCFTSYILKYSGACYVQPTLAPSHCSLEGFDTKTISEREYWTATLPDGSCIGISDTCKFVFAFCHPLPLNLSDHCRNPESAVCQTDQLVESTKSWSMGAFENYTRFYENVDTDQVGFHVQYTKGSNPGDPNCTDGLNTRIIFVCNTNAKWTNEDVTFSMEVERDNCMYNIVMQYYGACKSYGPPSDAPSGINNRLVTIYIGAGASIAGVFVVMIIITVTVLVAYKVFPSRRSSTVMSNFASDTPANRSPRPVAPTENEQPNEEDEDDANEHYTTYPQTQALL